MGETPAAEAGTLQNARNAVPRAWLGAHSRQAGVLCTVGYSAGRLNRGTAGTTLGVNMQEVGKDVAFGLRIVW